jgi:hypothetical protein
VLSISRWVTEIVNGDSLKTILNKLKGGKMRLADLDAPFPAEVIRQVSLSTGSSGLGAVRQIKDGAPLNWPSTHQGGEFERDRTALENQLPRAVTAATGFGPADAGAMNDIKAALSRMQSRLDKSVGDQEPGQHIAGKRSWTSWARRARSSSSPTPTSTSTCWATRSRPWATWSA